MPAQGPPPNRRRRRRRRTRRTPPPESTDSDSDATWHSPRGEANAFDEMPERRGELFSDEGGLDLESGELERKVHSSVGGSKKREERECRICQVVAVVGENNNNNNNNNNSNSNSNNDGEGESGVLMELGCCCKGDLGSAHRHCADTWFKIRGNTICEICGATALNVAGEQINDPNTTINAVTATSAPSTTVTLPETQRFWHGRRLMNILLGCMVFAFIVSWVFHFNLLPHH